MQDERSRNSLLSEHVLKLEQDRRAAVVLLQMARNRLAILAKTFNGTNFTDRHGDGPMCQNLVNNIDKFLKGKE